MSKRLDFNILKEGLLSITPAITTPLSLIGLLGGNLYRAAEQNEKDRKENDGKENSRDIKSEI